MAINQDEALRRYKEMQEAASRRQQEKMDAAIYSAFSSFSSAAKPPPARKRVIVDEIPDQIDPSEFKRAESKITWYLDEGIFKSTSYGP